ncbi:hypothetical protein [Hydrogenimonas sp.]
MMRIKILIILSIAFISIGCSKDIPYEEVSKSELKALLNTNFDTDEYECGWGYGRDRKYHLFELTCGKKKRPRDSFLTVKKRVKIKIKDLNVTVDPTLEPVNSFPGITLYNDNIIIKW